VSVIWEGMQAFRDTLKAIEDAANKATETAVKKGAALIEAKAKARSPVLHGANRRSIHVEGPIPMGFLGYSASIGPSMIYSRRLELGFSGTDAIGRAYHQAPRPYLAPGLADAQPELAAIFSAAWAAATSGL
jgi:HK97 gp10 family phage protein